MAEGPTAQREGEGGVRLLSGLDDDAAAVPDLDAQVMIVEHPHSYERRGVGKVGIDAPGPSQRAVASWTLNLTKLPSARNADS